MLMSRRTFLKLKKGAPINPTQRKKVDRVARYQALAAGWKNSKFLSSQPFGAKEGRKLQLATSFRSTTSGTMGRSKKMSTTYKPTAAPTDKRRDNMTFKLRKVMQGKNFVGNMKEFYYNPAKQEERGEDEITEEQREQLKMIKRLIS